MNRILVTGAGALLGQGILRCLKFSKKNYYIVSADPDVHSTGHALADKSYVIPFANKNTYLEEVKKIIKEEKIELVLIGTDVELPIFAESCRIIEKECNCKIVISPESVIEIANDKWLTAEFLRKNNYPYPKSALTSDKEGMKRLVREAGFPFIAKPVDGARSKGLKTIKNSEDLDYVLSYPNNMVVQEKISEDKGEFTTGCIVIDGKCKAVVSMVRDLRDGNTWRAYRNQTTSYDITIAQIAERLGVEGPVNFQYRIKNDKPVIFEINGRFSGTTPLRLIFGFNEVEAIVEYYLNGNAIVKPNLKEGTILRTFSDVFIENEVLNEFNEEKKITYKAIYFPFDPSEK